MPTRPILRAALAVASTLLLVGAMAGPAAGAPPNMVFVDIYKCTADGGWQLVSVPERVADKLLQKDGWETWHRDCIVLLPV